jgi:hypothetical protein
MCQLSSRRRAAAANASCYQPAKHKKLGLGKRCGWNWGLGSGAAGCQPLGLSLTKLDNTAISAGRNRHAPEPFEPCAHQHETGRNDHPGGVGFWTAWCRLVIPSYDVERSVASPSWVNAVQSSSAPR